MYTSVRGLMAVITVVILLGGCGSNEEPSSAVSTYAETIEEVAPSIQPTTTASVPTSSPSTTPTTSAQIQQQTETLSFPIKGQNPSGNSYTRIELPPLKELWQLSYAYDCSALKGDKYASETLLRVRIGHYTYIIYSRDNPKDERKVLSTDTGGQPEIVEVEGTCPFTVDVPASSLVGNKLATVRRPFPASHQVVIARGAGTSEAEEFTIPAAQSPLLIRVRVQQPCTNGIVQFENESAVGAAPQGDVQRWLDGSYKPRKYKLRASCPWVAVVETEPADRKIN